MAQTGDPTGTGTGGSGHRLKAEFSAEPHVRGTLLDGARLRPQQRRQPVLHLLRRRHLSRPPVHGVGQGGVGHGACRRDQEGRSGRNGAVTNPDKIVKMQVAADAAEWPSMSMKRRASPPRRAHGNRAGRLGSRWGMTCELFSGSPACRRARWGRVPGAGARLRRMRSIWTWPSAAWSSSCSPMSRRRPARRSRSWCAPASTTASCFTG